MGKLVEVTQTVLVDIPETVLTPEFMEEFRRYFYDFTTPEEHLCHIAQLHARGLAHEGSFIEGYGKVGDLGISFDIVSMEVQVEGENYD